MPRVEQVLSTGELNGRQQAVVTASFGGKKSGLHQPIFKEDGVWVGYRYRAGARNRELVPYTVPPEVAGQLP